MKTSTTHRHIVNVVEPKIVKIKTKKGKMEKRWKSAAPSQVQPSQCPSERSKALESNSSLDVFQTNHQGSVAWIDLWLPIRIIRQNYVRFGDRIENAVRAAQLSKISRQLWRCISMKSIASDKSFIAFMHHHLHPNPPHAQSIFCLSNVPLPSLDQGLEVAKCTNETFLCQG